MRWLLALLLGLAPLSAAAAEPAVKVVNFTADWCAVCRQLNPRLAEALAGFDPEEVARVDLDLTGLRGASPAAARFVRAAAREMAQAHKAGHVWDRYGPATGLAVIVAADNGEALMCLTADLEPEQMASRLRQSRILALKAPPGRRIPGGPACPPPRN